MLFRSRRRYRRDTRRASIIEPGGADRDLRRPYLHGRSLYARQERERSFRDRGRLRFLPPAATVYFIFSIRVIVPALPFQSSSKLTRSPTARPSSSFCGAAKPIVIAGQSSSARSEERRVGKGGVSTCKSWGST